MMRRRKKHLVFAGLAIVILSAWLLLATGLNIPPVEAQNFLDEDEIVALKTWGDTQDPNIASILAIQVVTQANLSLSEVHFGYDKASGALLDDPTISRSAFQVTSQSAAELKQGSDIDPSRIRFGSGYRFGVEPGLAPEIYEQLAKAALSGHFWQCRDTLCGDPIQLSGRFGG